MENTINNNNLESSPNLNTNPNSDTPILISEWPNPSDQSEASSDTNSSSSPTTSTKENKLERVLEYVFDKFSIGVRIIGPIFAFALTTFVFVVAHTFFNIILLYWEDQFGVLIKIPLVLMAVYILFSILFNYFLAVLVRPGSLEDLMRSKYYRKNDPLNTVTEDLDLGNLFKNPNNVKETNTVSLDKGGYSDRNLEIKLKLKISNNSDEEINSKKGNDVGAVRDNSLFETKENNINSLNSKSNNTHTSITNNNTNGNHNGTYPNNNLLVIDGESSQDIFNELDKLEDNEAEERTKASASERVNLINNNEDENENEESLPSIGLLGHEYDLKHLLVLPRNNTDVETIQRNNKILHEELTEKKFAEEELERYKDKLHDDPF